MSDDNKRPSSKYPPPDPVFLKEHKDTVDQLRLVKTELVQAKEKVYKAAVTIDKLRRIVNGGPTDPWTDEGHFGNVLLRIGWEHVADTEGLCWKDPVLDERGVVVLRTLPEALSVACKRLIERQLEPTVFARLAVLIPDDEEK